jgi:hypothetical protein
MDYFDFISFLTLLAMIFIGCLGLFVCLPIIFIEWRKNRKKRKDLFKP